MYGCWSRPLDLAAFRHALLQWFANGRRDLPWRRVKDPYRIWLSEIMLQQTRAAAAIPYYEAFLRSFPTVRDLARASESEVLAAWSGLGYYSRARNLRKAAIQMEAETGFPAGYERIRALPGVGPYTAAAVASIAFGLPHAVLDGNVMRVMARLMADPGDISSARTRRRFQEAADGWLDRAHPGDFNQAMMELGATVCLPREPLCLTCPVSDSCRARAEGRQRQFPVKLPKSAPLEQALNVAIVRRAGRILMWERPKESSRMACFWELPAAEDLPDLRAARRVGEFKHSIVNHRYLVTVWEGKASRGQRMEWVSEELEASLPVTTITRKALRMLRNS